MLEWLSETFTYHTTFYGNFLRQQWAHISPVKYGVMLIGVAVFGWILMRNSIKKC